MLLHPAHGVVGGGRAGGQAARQALGAGVRGAGEAQRPAGVLGALPAQGHLHPPARRPQPRLLAGVQGVLPRAGKHHVGVLGQLDLVVARGRPHLARRRGGRVGPHGVLVAAPQRLGQALERAVGRPADGLTRPQHAVRGAGADHEVGAQRAHGHGDAAVPARVRVVRELAERAGAVVRARAHPAQAVEGVQHLGLPVERPGRLDLQQRGAVARPVQRPVRVVPVEGHLLAAEPVPLAVVHQRVGTVHPRGQRQRHQADHDHRRPAPKPPPGPASAVPTAKPPPARTAPARARAGRPGRGRSPGSRTGTTAPSGP